MICGGTSEVTQRLNAVACGRSPVIVFPFSLLFLFFPFYSEKMNHTNKFIEKYFNYIIYILK